MTLYEKCFVCKERLPRSKAEGDGGAVEVSYDHPNSMRVWLCPRHFKSFKEAEERMKKVVNTFVMAP